MDFADLKKQVDDLMNKQRVRSLSNFDGYSLKVMHHILHLTFGSQSPLQLQKLPAAEYVNIPMLNQFKYLANLIVAKEGIKLTKTGALPPKIVAELYEQGFLKDKYIEKGFAKINKEANSPTVTLTRIILELSGLAKKRKGVLSMTKKGENTITNDEQLLNVLIDTMTTKFNWAYFDGYGDNEIGQLGFGFSLLLLSKYGAEKRNPSFYAEKYFKAFPHLLDTIEPSYSSVEKCGADCYSYRSFDMFLAHFGLVKIIIEGKGLDAITFIEKTDLFDKFIKVIPIA